MTLTELLGFFGIIASIVTGVWIIIDRFGNLESRVGNLEIRMDKLEIRMDKLEIRMDRVEVKLDEILFYLTPRKKHKKSKYIHQKH